VDHENNYVGRSNWLLECLNVLQHCHQRLSILHFDSAKLFSDLVKFLDISAKPFFSYDLWLVSIIDWSITYTEWFLNLILKVFKEWFLLY